MAFSPTPTDQQTAEELLSAIAFFAQKGWAPATSTNHSARLQNGIGFWMSRSGVDKSRFRREDLLAVDGQGTPLAHLSGMKASAETELHMAVYRRFPEVNCVLHTHSLLGTWLSARHVAKERVQFSGWEILKGLTGNTTHETSESLPVVPNSQRMPDILAHMDKHWEMAPKGFLIAGHGLYTWGKTIAEAKRHIETWEFLFELKRLGDA